MTEHVCKYQLRQTFTYRRFVCSGCPNIISITDAEELLNEYETLKAAFTIAIHLLNHADFKNGNTDPSGTIDEGEVHACRLMDKIKELVPQLYADTLEGKP